MIKQSCYMCWLRVGGFRRPVKPLQMVQTNTPTVCWILPRLQNYRGCKHLTMGHLLKNHPKNATWWLVLAF